MREKPVTQYFEFYVNLMNHVNILMDNYININLFIKCSLTHMFYHNSGSIAYYAIK